MNRETSSNLGDAGVGGTDITLAWTTWDGDTTVASATGIYPRPPFSVNGSPISVGTTCVPDASWR